jgi:hypothetical protein
VLAVALLVIATGVLTAPASRAQNIPPVDHAYFDPAPCPKPNLPGSQPDPWIQIQPTAVDI